MPRSPLPPFTVRPPCKRCGWPKTPGAIYPGRALQNAFSAEWHGREEELAARQAEVEKEYLATVRDEVSRGAVWAGESVDLVNDVPSAAEIINRIIAQAAAVLRLGARLLKD